MKMNRSLELTLARISHGSLCLFAVACAAVSCAPTYQPEVRQVIQVEENPIPGTVSEPWVEPMYDTISVPAQLDPAGNYYRLPHKTVVEIRPGRFQKVEYSNETDAERRQNNVLRPR